jgi:predicted molibdopterin-dependent oxidoreductase YjgC
MAQRILNNRQGNPFNIEVDGHNITAHEGETVATVLLAAGLQSFASHAEPYAPSRLFCGMGTCQQCLVTIDNLPNCQACRVLVRPGMKVTTSDEH